jgi:hypothetical protein
MSRRLDFADGPRHLWTRIDRGAIRPRYSSPGRRDQLFCRHAAVWRSDPRAGEGDATIRWHRMAQCSWSYQKEAFANGRRAFCSRLSWRSCESSLCSLRFRASSQKDGVISLILKDAVREIAKANRPYSLPLSCLDHILRLDGRIQYLSIVTVFRDPPSR